MPVRIELTEAEIADIRRRHAAGATARRLAARFGVSVACIGAIVRGRPWRHLQERPVAALGDLFERKG